MTAYSKDHFLVHIQQIATWLMFG